jgi:hypothetical protein
MRVLFASGVLLCASSAHAQLMNFQTSFSGSVNGGPVAAAGSGVVDLGQTGMSMASVDFSDRPMSFDPLSVSMISNLCANAYRDIGSPDNLFALSGGNYSTARTFSWIGLPGSSMSIDSTVINEKGELFSTSVVSGNYNGPTDIIGIQDYSITWLPSAAPGEFFEAGTVVLDRASGDTLIMQFATVFSGLQNDLQQQQFGIGTFDTSFDGTTLTLEWDGEFMVPAPASGLLFAGLGTVAVRRRRH